MEHSFDIDIAKEYGIECAIVLKHLYFWIRKNEANEEKFYDGRYWTYNSVKAFSELFPYMSERKVRYTLDKMEENGLIVVGNYNKSQYDRTKWYALTNLAYSILQKEKIHLPFLSNGNDANVEPIPDINTNINTDNKQIYCANDLHDTESYDDFFESVWKLYPIKKGKGGVSKTKKKVLQRIGYDQICRCIARFIKDMRDAERPRKYWMHGSTFFNSGYVDYLDENWNEECKPANDSVEDEEDRFACLEPSFRKQLEESGAICDGQGLDFGILREHPDWLKIIQESGVV